MHICLQENDPKHSSKPWKECLGNTQSAGQHSTMEKLVQSLDPNPIELLWEPGLLYAPDFYSRTLERPFRKWGISILGG
ncbi:hypothetical protein DPEC_G00043150 [Dallia pectoralis]|uniref:Uncharacterized protein n=1 Tax=Dallia pectoralis TaxID=75939 RepID=A0ACC2HA17_DALPE|nr:hypothetical protein DPEC_G00043150 [Dallia pectoralis]